MPVKPYKMTVGMLKQLIEDLPDNMEVFVGCQGYTNFDFKNGNAYENRDTFVIVHDGKLFIADSCAIETENGETI